MKNRSKTVYINTDINVDVEVEMYDINTEDLIDELERRKSEGVVDDLSFKESVDEIKKILKLNN